jgi:ankyrin repeat protein
MLAEKTVMNTSFSRSPFGGTPLHTSVWQLDEVQVQFLLMMGEDLNLRDNFGKTPLHLASWPHDDFGVLDAKREIVARLLLRYGADVQAGDPSFTPLHDAALWGCLPVAKVLLEYGALPNHQSENGWTALHAAVVGGHAEMVQFLIENGADINDGEAKWGGEGSVVDFLPKGKFTPLGLALASIDLTIRSTPERYTSDIKDISRFQAVEELLRRSGGRA